jgi:outer membrane protein insertion porin family
LAAALSPAFAAPMGAQAVTVAVLPFGVNADPDLAYLKSSLPDLVAGKLRDAGFNVVAAEIVDQALQKKAAQTLDLKTAKDLALLTGANYAVYGALNQLGESLSLDARVVEAFDARPPAQLFVSKDGLINLLPAVDELVERMRLELLRKEAIVEIGVEGNNVLDKDVVLMRLSIHKGDVFDVKVVNTELHRVYDLGYFEDVKVVVRDVPGGKKLVFVVEEKPLIQAMGVKGAKEISEDDILAAVSTKKGAVLNPKLLSDDLNAIRELYRKKGYYKAQVDYQLEGQDKRQKRLTFAIDEGHKLAIKGITITGAEQLDPSDIKGQLALKEEGWFSFITKSGILKEEMLERDAAAIEAFYGNRGFVDVKVGQPEVDIRDDGIYINFNVQEGSRYKMGKVTFEGDLIEAPEKLAEAIVAPKMAAEDKFFDRSALRDDRQKLIEFYTNYGFAYAESDVRLNTLPENKTVDVAFIMSKHQKVYIRRVIVEGNSKTRDNVILRQMRLTDGDQFSGKALRRSQERLQKMDYFAEVDIQPVPTGNPNEMDLKVKVKDKPTGSMSGGAGYSSYDGIFFTANVQERNLFGKGYVLGVSGKWGSKTTAYVLSFFNPRVNDSQLGMGVDLYNRSEDYISFSKDTTGGILKTVYPLGEYTDLYSNYRFDYYKIYDVANNTASSIQSMTGYRTSSVISVTAVRDTTNNRMSPSSGTVNSLSIANGGGFIGGDDNFVKYIADSHYYMPVWKDTVFHWRGQIGLLHQNSDTDLPVFERFFLGGIENVRGYSTRKISSSDDDTGERIGGTKEFFTNFEYLFPISKEFGITGVLFFDAGNTWKENEMFFSSSKIQGDPSPGMNLYKSIGPGIKYQSPMGPLQVYYGYGLDKLEGSGRQKFEFSFGQQF